MAVAWRCDVAIIGNTVYSACSNQKTAKSLVRERRTKNHWPTIALASNTSIWTTSLGGRSTKLTVGTGFRQHQSTEMLCTIVNVNLRFCAFVDIRHSLYLSISCNEYIARAISQPV